MSMEPSDWFTPGELSDCCGAPVYNPGDNETGICKECKEHCEIEKEGDRSLHDDADREMFGNAHLEYFPDGNFGYK